MMAFVLYSCDPLETSANRARNDAAGGRTALSGLGSGSIAKCRQPSLCDHPMDVYETDKAFKLVTDAPGLSPQDIKLEVHQGVITISGEPKATPRTEGPQQWKVWRQEREPVKFMRSFELPQTANPDSVTATIDKGVLTVTIGKRPEPKKPEPRRITVQAGPKSSL